MVYKLLLEFTLFSSLLLPCWSTLYTGQTKLITPEIDNYIKHVLQQWNLTGLAVAIVRQDSGSPTGWHQEFGSYGIAKANGTPVTPDTLFSIASNSKLFTAVSMGLLISNETLKKERGVELSWSTKAKDVFGDIWGLMDEEASHGTSIQDMLSHRTGLPRHDASMVPRKGELTDKIRTLRYLRSSAEFREIYQYNNLMYDSLAYLPEVLVNQSLPSYVDQHIFKPLNMSTATYSVAEAEAGQMAHGFQVSGQDLKRGLNGTKKAIIPHYMRPLEEAPSVGSGGVIASAKDMATWVSTLLVLGRHPHHDREIIPMQVVKHAATGVSVPNGIGSFPEISASVYGTGQTIYSYRGHEVVEHGGAILGFSSVATRLPNDNLGIVLLSNDWLSHLALDVIKWRLIDQIVVRAMVPNSPYIGWNARYIALQRATDEESRVFTPRPKSPTPPPPYSLQGSYYHPTYGILRPCHAPGSLFPSEAAPKMMATMSASSCSEILNSLPVQRILDISDLSIPTFIIPYMGLNTTAEATTEYIRLTHFSGNLFNATAIWTNIGVRLEEGLVSVCNKGRWDDNGDVIFPLQDFLVEWVATEEEEGLAFKGNFWGMGAGAKEPSGIGKEGAEVWFSKVEA